MKIYALKIYITLALMYEQETSFSERVKALFGWLCAFGPIMFINSAISGWFLTYQGFAISVVCLIFLNMTLGAAMHFRKGTFNWVILLKRTWVMVWVLLITYFTLEILISTAGDNSIIKAFRIVIQVTTLVYPASKILKNIFILSNGEHPPKWVIKRMYNFQANGDLRELFEPQKK